MSKTEWTTADIPDLEGRTVVMTGANSGLGLESTRNLARARATVIMACRNAEKATRAVADIRASVPDAQIVVQQLDLASLASVRSFSEALLTAGTPIDILMNNAGLMALDESRTVDGFETQIGVNHLGHFALTGLLLPLVAAAPNGRIVAVSSDGHRPGKIHLDDLMCDQRRYSRWGAYFQSKLANLLFTSELDRRLRKAQSSTIAVAAHPGMAKTELGKNGKSVTNVVMRRATPVLIRTGVQGCESQLRAAVDLGVRAGEYYGPRFHAFGHPVLETPSRRARDVADAQELWELSERLTNVTYQF